MLISNNGFLFMNKMSKQLLKTSSGAVFDERSQLRLKSWSSHCVPHTRQTKFAKLKR
jgi:hypothetical protein